MLQALSLPVAAKVCAAVVVLGSAGFATYEIADLTTDDSASVAAESPAALAYDSESTESSGPEDKDPVRRSKDSDEQLIDEADADHVDGIDADDRDRNPATAAEGSVREPAEEADVEAHIEILWPEDQSHWTEEHVVFEGESEPGSQVFAGPYAATVDAEGNWRIELILGPGANRATITAEDPAGNVADDSVTVWLDVEPEVVDHEDDTKDETEHDEVLEVEFSANQQYGECDAEVPYDVFWGTATPDSVVTISSAYGGATVEVGELGHWEKKVFFENAPRGQAFAVTVAGTNGSKTFEFVAVAIEDEVPAEEPGAGDEGSDGGAEQTL